MTTEPLTRDEARNHLRVTVDDPFLTDLDDYIKAARLYVEEYCNISIVSQTRTLILDSFPGGAGKIKLPNGPVTGITSIAYIDTDGVNQTVAGSPNHIRVAYPDNDIIMPVYGTAWPSTRDQIGAVTITYTAGMMTTGPSAFTQKDIMSAIKLVLADLWDNRATQVVGTNIGVNKTTDNLLAPHRREMGI